MQDQRLLPKIARAWARDSHLDLSERLRKGAQLLSETATARIQLRSCSRLGPGARVTGRVSITNHGTLAVGSGLVVHATFLPVELMTGSEGTLELGDDVWVNFGSVLAAAGSVRIGSRVMIGQHCIVSDLELPERALEASRADARPIEIGDDAWLAGRVTVVPGVSIGAGAVVTAGSIVESDVPPHVVAGGCPARVLRSVTNGSAAVTRAVPESLAKPETAPVEAEPSFRGTLISDFTIDELADELRAANGLPIAAAEVAPFGQVTQVLMSPPASDAADFAVVWTRAEGTIRSFARVLSFEAVDEAALLAEVDAFAALIKGVSTSYKAMFVPSWVLPPWVRGLGMIDLGKGGIARALLTMNLRLAEALSDVANVFVLDAARWVGAAGRGGPNPRAWYLGKMAVPRPMLAEAASDIRAALAGIGGGARKLLVVDLDDTLWGGIVGDVGWQGLRLGGHDGQGEAFVDFQRSLKSLKQRGIVLGIVSKNEESVALDAMRSHPEMVLREDDFVGHRINWNDKARNIAELTAELNLGLQSVVFIDDNPVERARVREALPEVYVPEWPEDKLLYPSALMALRCFDAPRLSKEDMERTRLYAEERKRENLQKQVGSIDEWLKTLELRVRVEALGPANLARATQLLNKTNQLNLATRRLTENELTEWARGNGRKVWTVTVIDRFGDAGLTGLLGLEHRGELVEIVDYLLSCRVMGRKVEETMLHLAVDFAVQRGARQVLARYAKTPKNKPCLTVFAGSGFTNVDDRDFTWDAKKPYPLPEAITLEWKREP